MKRGLIFLFILLFLVACSKADTKEEGKQAEVEEGTELKPLETEVLFTHDHEEPGDYDLQSIKLDAAGQTMVFTGKEDIDRSTEYYTYFVDKNDNVVEGIELAKDENQERRCTDMFLSPNGDYLVYNCHDKGIEFSVYDMNAEETIHQVEPSDDHIRNIFGISNDKIVYYEIENDDYQTELVLYNAETDEKTSLVLQDLFNIEENLSIEDPIQSDDGKYLLVNAFTGLYLIDVENKSAEEIVNVEKKAEENDSETLIYSAVMSPDAKYLYYQISGNDSKGVQPEFTFHNLATDEVTVYGDFDYYVRGFDEHGNVLLQGEEELYLHHPETEETRLIPDIKVKTYMGYFTLSHSGKYLVYTDKEKNEDGTRAQKLKRVSLGDISTYETVELDAKAEKEVAKIEDDQIALTEANFDEEEMLLALWESSPDFMFPTVFPGEVESVTQHYSINRDIPRYSQTIHIKTDSFKDYKIDFTAQSRNDRDVCVGFDDLDHIDTIDGDDYYFYDYQNKDVEAAVATDKDCYFFAAEDYSKEDMMEMAKSLKAIDQPFHDLSLEGLKFPTKFPLEKPEARSPRVISYKDGEKVDFLIDYRGNNDNESDIKMDLELRTNKPSLFKDDDDEFTVDIDGFEKAYFHEKQMKLFMYDGNYYYIVDLSISGDQIQAFGSEHIKDIFIEIGNSFE